MDFRDRTDSKTPYSWLDWVQLYVVGIASVYIWIVAIIPGLVAIVQDLWP